MQQVNGRWVVRSEPGRGESSDNEDHEQQYAQHGQRLTTNAIARAGGEKKHWHKKNTAVDCGEIVSLCAWDRSNETHEFTKDSDRTYGRKSRSCWKSDNCL
jgi:hypothetical protein